MRIQQNVELKVYSRMGTGGPADSLAVAETTDELIESVRWAADRGIPYRVIGLGANTIFTDEGYRGLIVINQARGIGSPAKLPSILDVQQEKEKHHLVSSSWCLAFDTSEPAADYSVQVDSGVILEELISWALGRNLAGLEFYTGVPSTVGGALYSNIHFANHLIGPRVLSAQVLDECLNVRTLSPCEMELGYDSSVFRHEPLIVLSAELAFSSAEEVADAISRRNAIFGSRENRYPKEKCCGSIFKNISAEQQARLGLPHKSAGWLIDQCGLKGSRAGDAVIWEGNANWILNTGNAGFKDIETLLTAAREKVLERFAVELEPEVEIVREA